MSERPGGPSGGLLPPSRRVGRLAAPTEQSETPTGVLMEGDNVMTDRLIERWTLRVAAVTLAVAVWRFVSVI